jgi:hypothetical protein
MRHWLLSILSKRVRRSPRSTLPSRPTLETLEDRCVPSANITPILSHGTFIHSLGLNATVANAPATNIAATNTLHNVPNQATLAALNQLFTDFNRTLQQVLSSQNLQQFVVNETAMLRLIGADLANLRATEPLMVQVR